MERVEQLKVMASFCRLTALRSPPNVAEELLRLASEFAGSAAEVKPQSQHESTDGQSCASSGPIEE
jgi:hypothetical protein